MKKILSFFMLTLLTAGFSAKAADEIYAVWDESNTTLTLYYNDQREAKSGVTNWSAYQETATTVVLDASMQAARPESTSHWFRQFEKLTEIRNLEYLNTSEVKYMQSMFYRCEALTSIDLSKFNTEKVTDMGYMFFYCKALTSLDLNNFNTEKVTNMREMFTQCISLKSLNLGSSFNTAEVTNMESMFWACQFLTSIDLSNFNTEKVTDMHGMFGWCQALTSIDLSNFNTANVSNMSYMFSQCTSLKSLDFGSSFNTANVGDMSDMFSYCEALTSIDLSRFNTENVTNMSRMFSGCKELNSIDLSTLNTENVTNMSRMFSGCKELNSIDLSTFNTDNVTDMAYMFQVCEALTSIDLSNFNTANVTNMQGMFDGCKSLTSLDLSRFNTDNVTDMSYMFNGCEALTSLDLYSFNTEKVTDMSQMFYLCSALTTIYWDEDLSERTGLNSDYMFLGCDKLAGGKGTVYDSEKADNTYALPDGKDGKNGYFTTFDMNDKTLLYSYIRDMQRLYDFAAQYVPETELAALKNTINAFRDTYNTGTESDIKVAVGLAPMMLENAIELLMSKGKTALKALLDGKLQTGDNQTCTDIISGAKAKIDALAWDDSKTVAENIAMLNAAVRDIIADADNDLANARISTGIEEADSQKPEVGSQKIMRNGSIYILRDGKTYTLTGAEVIR